MHSPSTAPMPRVAVIDIGTNSVKMVVGERGPRGDIAIVAEGRQITRLGEGVAATGTILPNAMERTIDALVELARRAREAGAERIAAVGTAALRDARNGAQLGRAAKERAGLEVEIIAGEREAALAYAAVRHDPTLPMPARSPLLVFDIGGGSTELVCGAGESLGAHASMAIGAVGLTERFLKTDPPADAEYEAAVQEAASRIGSFRACREDVLSLAGVGGTVVNTAGAALGGSGDIHGSRITRRQVEEVARLLRSMPLAERRGVPGLEPGRADIILGGIAILSAVMSSFGAQSFTVSTRGIRYALLWELLSG